MKGTAHIAAPEDSKRPLDRPVVLFSVCRGLVMQDFGSRVSNFAKYPVGSCTTSQKGHVQLQAAASACDREMGQ